MLTSTGTSEQTCISPTTSCCIFTFLSTGGLEPVPLGLRSPSPHRQRECGPPSHRELWKARNERKMAEEGADVCTSHPSPGPLHFQIHAIYSVLQEHVSVFTLQYSAKKLPSNNQEARDEFTDLHSGYVLKLTIASYPALQRLFNINDGLKKVRKLQNEQTMQRSLRYVLNECPPPFVYSLSVFSHHPGIEDEIREIPGRARR